MTRLDGGDTIGPMSLAEAPASHRVIDAGLANWAGARGVGLGFSRRRLVCERLWARLESAVPGEWVVRGGRAIDYRFDGRVRPTFDLDLVPAAAPPVSLGRLREHLKEIVRSDVGDGWRFSLARLQRSIVPNVGVVGFKAFVRAEYDGHPFDDLTVDLSKVDGPRFPAESLEVPSMLGGLRLPVWVVRPEVQIAEKVRTLTVRRTKMRSFDLVDCVALILAQQPDPLLLRAAAEETFRMCGTHPLSSVLDSTPLEWVDAFQVHGAAYGLTHLSTAQGMAILGEVWARAIDPNRRNSSPEPIEGR